MVTPLAARRLVIHIYQTESLPLEDVEGTVSLINAQGQEILDFTTDYGVWMESDRMIREVPGNMGVYDISLHPSDVLPNVFYRLVLTNTRNGQIMSTIDFEMPSGSGDITLSEIVNSALPPSPDVNRFLAFLNKFPDMFIDGQILVGDAMGNLENEVPGIATIPDRSLPEVKFTADVITKLDNTPSWLITAGERIPLDKLASGTAALDTVPIVNSSGQLVFGLISGTFLGAYDALPADAVGDDGNTAIIRTDPPAWAQKSSGSWGVVYTFPAGGGGGGGTTIHNGTAVPTALIGANGDYYVRRPREPQLTNPPELWLRNNDVWGRIIEWQDGNKFRGIGLSSPNSLSNPIVGQWYIQYDNASSPTELRFWERVGDQNAANWNSRLRFSIPDVPIENLGDLKSLMATDANATADYVWTLDDNAANPTWKASQGGGGTAVTLATIKTLMAADANAAANLVWKLDASGANPTWRTDSGLTAVASNNTLTGNGTSGSPLAVSATHVMEGMYDEAAARNSGNLFDSLELILNDDGDPYKVDIDNFKTWIGPGRTLEQLQDAVALMFTHDSAYSYDDTNGEIDTTFPEADASGIVRVYHATGLSANRDTNNDITHDFDIPSVIIGERVRFYAVWNITTAGTGAGSVGACWLSVSNTGVIATNNFGSLVGTRNLATGVTDGSTGHQYVEGGDYVAFNSISSQTLYIHRPGDGSNDAGVEFDLSIYMQRTKVSTQGFNPFSGRYGDLLDKPIIKISNDAALPTPSASVLGHRYQTNAGHVWLGDEEVIAGDTRVLNFSAFPTDTTSTTGFRYQGGVDHFSDLPDPPTTADEGKWWLRRDLVGQGQAAFIVVDDEGSYQSIAHSPETDHPYVGIWNTRGGAEGSHEFTAAGELAVFPDDMGVYNLFSVDSDFVAGTPTTHRYHWTRQDVSDLFRARVDNVESNLGGKIIWDGTQAEYDAIVAKDANTIYLVTPSP